MTALRAMAVMTALDGCPSGDGRPSGDGEGGDGRPCDGGDGRPSGDGSDDPSGDGGDDRPWAVASTSGQQQHG